MGVKKLFPHNYKLYAAACKDKQVVIGKMFVTEEESLLSGKKMIINFPTKTDWRKPSEYSYIEKGLLESWHVLKRGGAQYIITYGARYGKDLGVKTT